VGTSAFVKAKAHAVAARAKPKDKAAAQAKAKKATTAGTTTALKAGVKAANFLSFLKIPGKLKKPGKVSAQNSYLPYN